MEENYNHIDQIIRQKFEDFEPEPPVQVWEKIRSGINKTPPPSSSTGFVMPVIVAVSLLVFVAGLVHNIYYKDSKSLLSSNSSDRSIQQAGVISTGSTTFSDATVQDEFYLATAVLPTPDVSALNTNKEIKAEPKAAIPVREAFGKPAQTDKKHKKAKNNTPVNLNNTPRTGRWNAGLVQALKAGELSYADAQKYNLSPRDVRKLTGFQDYETHSRAAWSIGLYFNPEMSSCKDQSIGNTVSYNASLLPQISFSHFFMQSGINMRFTHDNGDYGVNYNRYLGTYEHVDYMTFDTVNNVVIPTYYTHTVDVWDTVNHYKVFDTKANYTYLEIPVLFGYRYSFGKFSIFAKAGPSASFLIYKERATADVPEEGAKIINENYQVPVRNTINWQLMMGAGFDYKLAEKISFSLEPTFRYSIKPEYDLPDGAKGNTKSFGIRAGLNYNF